jgi:hypothetical protein
VLTGHTQHSFIACVVLPYGTHIGNKAHEQEQEHQEEQERETETEREKANWFMNCFSLMISLSFSL